jgi:hypothetical protein
MGAKQLFRAVILSWPRSSCIKAPVALPARTRFVPF